MSEVGLEFTAWKSILRVPRIRVRIRVWVRLTLTLTLNLPHSLPYLYQTSLYGINRIPNSKLQANFTHLLNIDQEDEYRALHSDVEYSAEYRPGEPNIKLYIRMLNVALNIDLEGRI